MQKKKGFLKKLLIGFVLFLVLVRISNMISGPTPSKKIVEEKPKQVVEAEVLTPEEKLFNELEKIVKDSGDKVEISAVERNGGVCVFVSHEIDSFVSQRSLFGTIMGDTGRMLTKVFDESDLFDEFEYFVRVNSKSGDLMKAASISLTREESDKTVWGDVMLLDIPHYLIRLSSDIWIHPTLKEHIK